MKSRVIKFNMNYVWCKWSLIVNVEVPPPIFKNPLPPSQQFLTAPHFPAWSPPTASSHWHLHSHFHSFWKTQLKIKIYRHFCEKKNKINIPCKFGQNISDAFSSKHFWMLSSANFSFWYASFFQVELFWEIFSCRFWQIFFRRSCQLRHKGFLELKMRKKWIWIDLTHSLLFPQFSPINNKSYRLV